MKSSKRKTQSAKPSAKLKALSFALSFALCTLHFALFLTPSPVFAQTGVQLKPIRIGESGGFIPDISADFSRPLGTGGVLEKFFSNALGFFTVLGGLAFMLFFVIGAFSWLTAAGKQEQLQKAQNQITNALIGLIIIVAAYTVFFIIGKILGLDILNPVGELVKLKP